MRFKGQISTEYLIIVGFVVFLVIGVMGVALFYTTGSQDQIRLGNVAQFANTITTNAEEIYYAGEPSRRTFTAYLPIGVNSIQISGQFMIFNVSTGSGTNVILYKSNAPLQGNLTARSGVKRLQLVAQQTYVTVSEG